MINHKNLLDKAIAEAIEIKNNGKSWGLIKCPKCDKYYREYSVIDNEIDQCDFCGDPAICPEPAQNVPGNRGFWQRIIWYISPKARKKCQGDFS